MRYAILSLLQVAAALMAQEAEDARNNGKLDEMSQIYAARSALLGIISAWVGSEQEMEGHFERAKEVLRERKKR